MTRSKSKTTNNNTLTMCLSHFAAYKKNDDFIYKKTKQSNILEG